METSSLQSMSALSTLATPPPGSGNNTPPIPPAAMQAGTAITGTTAGSKGAVAGSVD